METRGGKRTREFLEIDSANFNEGKKHSHFKL